MSDEIILNPHNTNKHTERGDYMLRTSFEKVGARRSAVADKDGVIIAGNGAVKAALEAGIPLEVVKGTPEKLVVLQFDDLDIDGAGEEGEKARFYEVMDNRSQEVGLAYDPEEMRRLHAQGVDLLEMFTHGEMASKFDIELRETHDDIIKRFALPQPQMPLQEDGDGEDEDDSEDFDSSSLQGERKQEKQEEKQEVGSQLAPRFAVPIVLTKEQKDRWDEFKKRNGLHNDLKAFIYILDLYFEPLDENG